MWKKLGDILLAFISTKQFGTFCRTTANGFISVLIVYLSWLDYSYIPFIIAILNLITKEINKNFNPYYEK